MKKIGMIVAIEMDSVLSYYGKSERLIENRGFQIHEYTLENAKLYAVNSGIGEISAAAATQMLISEYDVELIVNFGVVGGLTDDMTEQRVCIVDNVIHYMFDLSEIDGTKIGQYPPYEDVFMAVPHDKFKEVFARHPEIKHVNCASGDKFVGTKEEKIKLNREFKADICEMEAAGILITAKRNNIPCVFIKAVSDGLCGGAETFEKELKKASDICIRFTAEVINSL